MYRYFVTGTDTEVGKTYATCQLLRAAAAAGLAAVGVKPISAGCEWREGEWQNEDALALQAASSIALPLSTINPIALEPPIAPHIAAAQAGVTLDFTTLDRGLVPVMAQRPELVLIEGAGGWRLPINANDYLSDWVKRQGLPVIVVVGMRLGCLNHAMLTVEAVQRDGLTLAGWVANDIDPAMPYRAENIATLTERINAPLLTHIRHNQPADSAALAAQLTGQLWSV